jgi:uncharacterized protein (DUF1778 family)
LYLLACAGKRKRRALAQIAVRVDGRLKRAVDEACWARGVTLTRFVQDALLDKLEEIADAEDLQRLRREPTRPLRDLIRDLGLDGEP